MSWNNLYEMSQELDLKSDTKNLRLLKAEIKKLMSEIHPDHSGGEFRSEEEKQKYYRLSEALEYCESQENMLIPLNNVSDLVKTIAESIGQIKKEPVDRRIGEISIKRQNNAKQVFIIPKISLGAVSAILVYVFLFPQTVQNHPFLKPLVDKYEGLITLYWFMSIFTLAIGWFVIWRLEKTRTAKIRRLFSLDVHRFALDFLRRYNNIFSRTNLRDILFGYSQKGKSYSDTTEKHSKNFVFENLFLIYTDLDLTTLDEATDLAIERYRERGWINKIQKQEIDDWYEITI